MKDLKTITKDIFEGQRLNQIFKNIPNRVILNKFLPNNGATTLEIDSKRHSIIVESNVPVIEGKQHDYNEVNPLSVLGVYEGIGVKAIVNYLCSNVTHKKIITTPESYNKVKKAVLLTRFDLYKDFFLLFDECERTIQDINYRSSIILPIDDFFLFKQRAFVSATPLAPSDPRFLKYGFKYIKIIPQFDYKKAIELIPSNSVLLSLKKYIEHNPNEHYCIFLNSTDTIAGLIDAMGIMEESKIFCARESVYKLRINKIKNAYDSLKPLSKYNFFTSRFYSAVDIKLDVQPTIIMISDVDAALHTMLDPFTESVQIIGRFRNGVNNIAHIATTQQGLSSMTRAEALMYLYGCESVYKDFKKLLKATTNAGAISTLHEAMNRVQYSNFLKEDGKKNFFMVDNFIDEERVKGYYKSPEAWENAYEDSTYFKVKVKPNDFPIDERLLNRPNKVISPNRLCQAVIVGLSNIANTTLPYKTEERLLVYNELQRKYPLIVQAYKLLGKEYVAELGYNLRSIKKEINKVLNEQDKSNFEFLNRLQEEFEVGKGYSAALITSILGRAINEYDLQLKAEISLLKEYFELSSRTTLNRSPDKKDIKGYKILKSKFGLYRPN